MTKLIFILSLVAVALFARPQVADAVCFGCRTCTAANPCTSGGFPVRIAESGTGCKTQTTGASGCSNSMRLVCDPITGGCDDVSTCTLTGIGCCGQPCPPPGTNCQPD